MTRTHVRLLPPPPAELLDEACLFLDLDGTLIEIASRPDAVAVDDDLINLLRHLLRSQEGRVVMVSGRPAAEVRALLRGLAISIAGSHGAEVLCYGEDARGPALSEPPAVVMTRLQHLAEQHLGVLVEVKPFGLAIHYRLAPGAARACEEEAGSIAAAYGYDLQPGKQVIELKFHRVNKGDAVRSFMALSPMAGSSPVFIGDDLTDEAGFAAAAELGGAGVLVGELRSTHASYRLPDVSAALRWLAESSEVPL